MLVTIDSRLGEVGLNGQLNLEEAVVEVDE